MGLATRQHRTIPEYRHAPFEDLLADLSGEAPLPGGGSAAAAVGALAASLVAKTARRCRPECDDVGRMASEADQARERLVSLVTVDAASHADALEARRAGGDVQAAVAAAAGPAAAIAEQAAIAANLAADVVDRAGPDLREEAMTGLRLAVAAAETASDRAVADDPTGRHGDRARAGVSAAHEALDRATAPAA